MEHMEFKETSSEMAFQNKTIEMDPVIPSKELFCAMECFDDPKCLAYDFDQISKCTLMTQIDKVTPGTARKVFLKTKGEKKFTK